MNVKLAAQLLSNSVADALEFLLVSNHPDFVGCEETINFIRTIDQLFDLLNTRDPYGLGLKEPVTKVIYVFLSKLWIIILSTYVN